MIENKYVIAFSLFNSLKIFWTSFNFLKFCIYIDIIVKTNAYFKEYIEKLNYYYKLLKIIKLL